MRPLRYMTVVITRQCGNIPGELKEKMFGTPWAAKEYVAECFEYDDYVNTATAYDRTLGVQIARFAR